MASKDTKTETVTVNITKQKTENNIKEMKFPADLIVFMILQSAFLCIQSFVIHDYYTLLNPVYFMILDIDCYSWAIITIVTIVLILLTSAAAVIVHNYKKPYKLSRWCLMICDLILLGLLLCAFVELIMHWNITTGATQAIIIICAIAQLTITICAINDVRKLSDKTKVFIRV